MIEHPLQVTAAIAAITALAFWVSGRFAWAGKIGASLLVIIFGALLSNFDLITAESPVYGLISGPLTSLAIVWLLLALDLRHLRSAGPRMLGAFGLAVLATVVGAVTAFFLFAAAFPDNGWKLAGVMTGTYSGGGLNFVGVGRALELPDALFTAAAASDNVMTTVWMGATLVAPLLIGRYYPPPAALPPPAAPTGDAASDAPAPLLAAERTTVAGLATLVAIGLLLVVAAEGTAKLVPAVPSVIWLTTYALVVAQIPAVRRLRGALQLGTLALHFFFAVLGIASRLSEIVAVGYEVFWFTVVVIAVHGALLYAFAWLARIDVETASVASQAAVGGPSTAMALAVARGRAELALPGVMAGLCGYALGNYAGIGIAHALRLIGGS